MKILLIRILSTIVGAAIVMILHELPKAYIFNHISRHKEPGKKHNIYRIHHYIDPVGMLLCITNGAGFSKPYMYRIKDQKTNLKLGVVGFLSLLLTFLVSILAVRFGFGITATSTFSDQASFIELLAQNTVIQIAFISISMFIVNLFPLSTFDMGLCVAGKSPSKYFAIIRNDYSLKMILLLLIIFRLIPALGSVILTQFLV